MATKRVNITVEEQVMDEFFKFANKKGIKFSTWVNVKMKEFIEEEKMIEEFRKKRSE
ncbi:hypothetical protein [Gracilibacillus sp. YIM 98692]|uniref:hypothetical protein n=1 Tax=Gracilibacillus sp. YIM 98692 TaxID=2663532 RepID=UPI0013D25F54|nr:hypothetical protein [Gracilibacillus sp. YIM 98692]